jgi:hypothetical protein
VTRARALAAAAAVAAGALALPAAAWTRTADAETGVPVAWPLPVVPWFLSDAPSFPSPGCAGEAEVAAVRASYAEWERGGLRLVYGGRIGERRTGLAGSAENVIVMRTGWCSVHPVARLDDCMNDPDVDCGGIYNCFEDSGTADQSIVALTTVLYDPQSGRLFDADMEVNGWDGVEGPIPTTSAPHGFYFTCDRQPSWSACTQYGQPQPGQPGCYGYDLRNTVTHEVGHVIGLAHPCGDGGTPSCSSPLPPWETVPYAARTMYPSTVIGETSKRDLSPDDVAGVTAIYPEPSGCGSAGPGALGALLAAGAALALRTAGLRRRARPRSRRPGACRR